eukprot:4062872-Pleurochrysis_carterae.AAC.1
MCRPATCLLTERLSSKRAHGSKCPSTLVQGSHIGMVVSSGPKWMALMAFFCGFDDGEGRLVTFDEIRVGFEMGSADALVGDE